MYKERMNNFTANKNVCLEKLSKGEKLFYVRYNSGRGDFLFNSDLTGKSYSLDDVELMEKFKPAGWSDLYQDLTEAISIIKAWSDHEDNLPGIEKLMKEEMDQRDFRTKCCELKESINIVKRIMDRLEEKVQKLCDLVG